jgi:hypothetical protein
MLCRQLSKQTHSAQEPLGRVASPVDKLNNLNALHTHRVSLRVCQTSIQAKNRANPAPRHCFMISGVEVIADPNAVSDAIHGKAS